MKIIHDIIIRSNRTDYKIKDRLCWGTRYPATNGETIFELEQTRNWFARDHFQLKPGYKVFVDDEPQEYIIASVAYTQKRPFKTILTATLA